MSAFYEIEMKYETSSQRRFDIKLMTEEYF